MTTGRHWVSRRFHGHHISVRVTKRHENLGPFFIDHLATRHVISFAKTIPKRSDFWAIGRMRGVGGQLWRSEWKICRRMGCGGGPIRPHWVWQLVTLVKHRCDFSLVNRLNKLIKRWFWLQSSSARCCCSKCINSLGTVGVFILENIKGSHGLWHDNWCSHRVDLG